MGPQHSPATGLVASATWMAAAWASVDRAWRRCAAFSALAARLASCFPGSGHTHGQASRRQHAYGCQAGRDGTHAARGAAPWLRNGRPTRRTTAPRTRCRCLPPGRPRRLHLRPTCRQSSRRRHHMAPGVVAARGLPSRTSPKQEAPPKAPTGGVAPPRGWWHPEREASPREAQ